WAMAANSASPSPSRSRRLKPRPAPAEGDGGAGRGLSRLEREGEGEAEFAAMAHLARDGELTAHQRHQPPRDREAEACPAVAARHRRVRLGELLEDGPELLRRDADPRVPHAELHACPAAVTPNHAGRHIHLTLIRELDRVADQVHEHLTHPGRI